MMIKPKILFLFLLVFLISCEKEKKQNTKTSKCASACACVDELVDIAEKVRDVQKKLFEQKMTAEEIENIENETLNIYKETGWTEKFERIQKYSPKKIKKCPSLKTMKGTIVHTGESYKDGSWSRKYFYDGYVEEDNKGNKKYFCHDGTLINSTKK